MSDNSRGPLRNAALAEFRHNLRTPVNHLLGYAELLIEEAAEMRNARALDALRQIHSAARATLTHVNELLSDRESVGDDILEEVFTSVRPRTDRIENCLDALRDDEAMETPEEWREDLERIRSAVQSLRDVLGNSREHASAAPVSIEPRRRKGSGPRLLMRAKVSNP